MFAVFMHSSVPSVTGVYTLACIVLGVILIGGYRVGPLAWRLRKRFVRAGLIAAMLALVLIAAMAYAVPPPPPPPLAPALKVAQVIPPKCFACGRGADCWVCWANGCRCTPLP